MMTAMHISVMRTWRRASVNVCHDSARVRDAHQRCDENLEEPDRLSVQGVAQSEEKEHVGAGKEHAGVEREPGEEEAQGDRGTEELGEVGRDDGDLCEGVEGVEYEPSPEESVFRS